MDDLEALAGRWGVERGYHDIFGRWHVATDDTVRAIVAALSRRHPQPTEPVPVPIPMQAFQGDARRLWGIAVQLYSVRSQRNCGIGDFRDLRDIIRIAARAGASAVGLNPLHALFLDRPDMASPYAPNSRLFLNPLYIALDDLDWFEPSESDELADLKQTDLVDYPRVAKLKLATLRSAYDRFLESAASQQKEEFEAFRVARGDALIRFSCFEVLRARYGFPWKEWPQPFANGDGAAIAELCRTDARECGFVQFMQWLADRQLARCRDEAANSGMPIGLYLDLAVGVDPSGADAWINQRTTVPELAVGAPPDELQPAGQNWGLAPFNPHALAENNFAAFRELLAAPMRHAGAVRLDHVLGLMRLYVVPPGKSDAEGAYIRFPFERLLRVVAEESQHYRCIFIGEDLGTVPEGFRETAARWGVWSYRVMIFERRHDGSFKSPEDYPAQALATFNTHDLPSFAGWMAGHDLGLKRGLGLDPGESDEQRENSRRALQQLLSQYRGVGQPEIAAVASFLGATPSRLVTMNIEDLLGVADQVNIPGTVEQHPNWRRRLPVSLEEWEKQPLFSAVADAFERAGRRF
jgi:4-alpha-glucanotransferase